MIVFFRYILRSIRRSPIQPIMILITLTVAVATLLSSAKIMIQLGREYDQRVSASDYYDLRVTLSAESDTRILLADEIERVIGESGEVIGEFALTGVTDGIRGDELVTLCALDLEEADAFYKFRFTEYDEITESTLKSSIVISTYASRAYGLGLGDKMTVSVLGERFEFTVRAIALPDGALSTAHGIIDTSVVMDALVRANPALAPISDGFSPANEVKIKLSEGIDPEEYLARISADPELGHTSVSLEEDSRISDAFAQKMWLMLTSIVISVVLVIAVIVILTSLTMLSVERRADTALFMISGADPDQLGRIAYLESLVYSLAAAVLGTALSIPICSWANTVFDWRYAEIAPEALDVLIALVAAPLVIGLSTLINNRKSASLTVSELLSEGRERKRMTAATRPAAILAAMFAVSLILTLALPVSHRYISAFAAIILIAAAAYLMIPRMISLLCSALGNALAKAKRAPAKVYLAVRTLGSSHPMIHGVRIISVLTALLLAVAACLMRAGSELSTVAEVFDCSYVVINADGAVDDILLAQDGIEDCFRVSMVRNVTTLDGEAMLAVSASEGAHPYLSENIRPERPLEKGEVAIASGTAKRYSISLGDTFTIVRGGVSFDLVVIDILPSGSNVCVTTAESVGAIYDTVCIRSSEGITEARIAELASLTEARGALMTELDAITAPSLNIIRSFATLMLAISIAAFASTVLGACNILLAANKARARERELYDTVGMTKRGVALAALAEGVAIALAALLVLLPLGLTTVSLVDLASNSFGFDIIF